MILEGRHARLEPLALLHAPDLVLAVQDEELWRYLGGFPHPRTLAAMEEFIARALAQQELGLEQPFAIVERASGRAVGSTRYMDIRAAHRGLEIGWTFVAPAFQRTAINTECKRLLLTHAFETLGCLRVQLKTDLRNLKSQRAIERLGAVREGVLRQHIVYHDGYVRDSVLYSITAAEWPEVKRRLSA